MNGFKVVCGFFTGVLIGSAVLVTVSQKEVNQRVKEELAKDGEE